MRALFIGFSDIVHPWYDDFLEAVGGRHEVTLFNHDQPVAAQFKNIDVVVDQGGWGTRAMIDAANGSVKLWQVIGTGLDHLDVGYILSRGIPLANTPGAFSAIALAEHAIFLMLCLSKSLYVSVKNARTGNFHKPMNEELEGNTLGLVGFGASARELARRASPLGMRVMAIDAVPAPKSALDELRVEFLGGPEQLDRLLAASDYVSLHVPLTSKTRHLIGRHAFEAMKPSACLINVARGEIVEESALIEALKAGRIRGAGLDVFGQEPLDPANPLLQMDNVIATPHIAGSTRGTSRRRGRAAAENIDRIAQNLPVLHQVVAAE